jgi:hypothetical protein
VFFRIYINNDQPRIREAIALAILSIVIAILSYRFIERPFRRPRLDPSRTTLSGLTAAALIFCVGTYVESADGLPLRAPKAYAMRSLSVMWEWQCGGYLHLTDDLAVCTFGAPWQTAARKALLWGDSISATIAPLINDMAAREGVGVALYEACSPMLNGATVQTNYENFPGYNQWCGAQRQAMLNLLDRSQDIRTVIVASSWPPLLYHLRGTPALFEKAISDAISDLSAHGREVVVIGTPPQWPHDPVPCAIGAMGLLRRPCSDDEQHLSRAFDRMYQGPTLDLIKRVLVRFPNVRFIDPGEHLCRGEFCITELNGEPLYRDGGHLRRNLTPETARQLGAIAGLGDIFSLPQ